MLRRVTRKLFSFERSFMSTQKLRNQGVNGLKNA